MIIIMLTAIWCLVRLLMDFSTALRTYQLIVWLDQVGSTKSEMAKEYGYTRLPLIATTQPESGTSPLILGEEGMTANCHRILKGALYSWDYESARGFIMQEQPRRFHLLIFHHYVITYSSAKIRSECTHALTEA